VHYATTPEGKIAYEVVGDGPVDLNYAPPGGWNLDLIWEYPPLERFLRPLASFSRLILMNIRGFAMSDPVTFAESGTAEDWVRDIQWVLDALGSERMATICHGDTVSLNLLRAATYPERVSALVLVGGYASLCRHDD
jgi:pimeloyl-ACP methyl ester carboxylesterase